MTDELDDLRAAAAAAAAAHQTLRAEFTAFVTAHSTRTVGATLGISRQSVSRWQRFGVPADAIPSILDAIDAARCQTNGHDA